MAKIYGLVFILFANLVKSSQDWQCVKSNHVEDGEDFYLILRKNANGENECAADSYRDYKNRGFRCISIKTGLYNLQSCKSYLEEFKKNENEGYIDLDYPVEDSSRYVGVLSCVRSGQNRWYLKPTYNTEIHNNIDNVIRHGVQVHDWWSESDRRNWCDLEIAKPSIFNQCTNCKRSLSCDLNPTSQDIKSECSNGFISQNRSIVDNCCITCCDIFTNNILNNFDKEQVNLIESPPKTVRVSYSVEVTYRATGYKKKSSETRTYEKTSDFTKAYESLSTDVSKALYNENSRSGSVSVKALGYGSGTVSGSSNSISASILSTAMNRVTDVSQKKENEEERYSKTNIEFQEGRFQVWRKVTQTLTIGQETLKLVEEDYQHDTHRDYRLNYYQNMATQFININYLPVGMKQLKPRQTILRYEFMVTTSPVMQ